MGFNSGFKGLKQLRHVSVQSHHAVTAVKVAKNKKNIGVW